MARLEVGKFNISIGLDAAVASNWSAVSRSPGFTLADLDLLLRLLGEGWIACSALDVAPQPVIGQLRDGQRLMLFAMAAADDLPRFNLDVMVDGRRGGHDRRLLACWQSWSNDRSQAVMIGDQPVESEAFLERFDRKSVSRRLSHGIPRPGANRHIAILHADPRQRLALVELAAAQIERQCGLPCVIVDNASVVLGNAAHVVGLAPSHRRSASDWLIVSPDSPAALVQDLELMERFVAGAGPSRARPSDAVAADAAGTGAGAGAAVEPLAALIERAGTNLDAGLAQLSPGATIGGLRALFQTVAGGAGAEDSESLLVAALLLRRMPSVLAGVADLLPTYVETVTRAGLAIHAVVAAQAAQACIDWLRRQGAAADRTAIGALERLLSVLAARVRTEVADAGGQGGPVTGPSRRQLWDGEDLEAVLDAFDAIGEIESLSPSLDLELLATVDRVRLACGRLTALGLCRMWPERLRAQSTGVDGRDMGGARVDPRLAGVAMLVAIDALHVDTVQASALVASLSGVEESAATRRSGMAVLDAVIMRNGRRRNAPLPPA